MSAETSDQTLGLQQLLAERTHALTGHALSHGGEIPTGQLEELERIARLAGIRAGVAPEEPRRRWPVALVLFATLAILSLLLFARVPVVEIELDLAVSELSFRSAQTQRLTNTILPSAVGLSGARELQPPRSAAGLLAPTAADPGTATSISIAADAVRPGTLTLEAIMVAPGTKVSVGLGDAESQYRLSLMERSVELRASLHNWLLVGTPGAPAQPVDFASPQPMVVQTDPRQTQLELTLPGPARNLFAGGLSVDRLSLVRIDQLIEPDRSFVRLRSTIRSGSIYFESLDGRERKLRPGAALRFGMLDGEIREILLQDDHIEVRFHGRVRGMAIGHRDNARSLMPTYLQWLEARHGLILLWGTTIYLFGLATGALRWWGVRL
jgi:hypothetical protein